MGRVISRTEFVKRTKRHNKFTRPGLKLTKIGKIFGFKSKAK